MSHWARFSFKLTRTQVETFRTENVSTSSHWTTQSRASQALGSRLGMRVSACGLCCALVDSHSLSVIPASNREFLGPTGNLFDTYLKPYYLEAGHVRSFLSCAESTRPKNPNSQKEALRLGLERRIQPSRNRCIFPLWPWNSGSRMLSSEAIWHAKQSDAKSSPNLQNKSQPLRFPHLSDPRAGLPPRPPGGPLPCARWLPTSRVQGQGNSAQGLALDGFCQCGFISFLSGVWDFPSYKSQSTHQHSTRRV